MTEPSEDKAKHLQTSLERAATEDSPLLSVGAGAIAQFILGTVPYAGGAGAALSQRYNSRRESRIVGFLEELVHELEGLRELYESSAEELLEGSPFRVAFFEILREVADSEDADRLAYLRKFLTNSAKAARPDESTVELFLRYIPRLAGSHLFALSVIYERQRSIPITDRLGRVELAHVPVRQTEIVAGAYTRQILGICLSDLENLGLLSDWRVLSGRGPAADGFCLTRNGLLFMKFIESDWERPGLASE